MATGTERSGLFATAIFNPALLSKDDLIGSFTARQDLLGRLIDDLRRVQKGKPPQHQLIIGQRGLGKTTLLRRFAFAIEDDPELSAAWFPLVFPEEQYNVKNLSDFWLNVADAFSDALDRAGDEEGANALDEKVRQIPTDPEQRSAAALEMLIAEANLRGVGLVLLIDNMDIVLDRLNHTEEWEFRRVISEEPRLYMVGASSRAIEALYEHGRAFYDYFQVHELNALGDDEMFALLRHVAAEQRDEGVLRVLEQKPARLRALRVLAGGNPRTLMLLYRVLARDPESDVQRDLEQLLDLYTPLYKARFEELPTQSQQIVDAIAIHWDPLTAAELAERLTPLSVNQVSAQLKRLEDFGVVEKAPWFGEKKAAFQISERFFNIWYLMRASRRVRRKLVWLVKFLEAWFEREEIEERAAEYLDRDASAIGAERYAEMALAYSQSVGDKHLRRSLEWAGLRAALDVGNQFDFSDLPPEVQGKKNRIERLGRLRKKILAMKLEGVDSLALWNVLGGAPGLSLAEKTKIVEDLPGLAPADVRAVFSKLEQAEALDRANMPDHTQALSYLYESLGNGEVTDAYDIDDTVALAKRKHCPDLPAIAIRAKFRSITESSQAAQSDEGQAAETALRTLATEKGFEASAFSVLGSVLRDRKLYSESEAAIRRAIELDPGNAPAWVNLAWLLAECLQRNSEAEQAYRRALELDEKNPWAWAGIGRLQARLNRFEEATQSFQRAAEAAPDWEWPLREIGTLLRRQGRYREAEEVYDRLVKLHPESVAALLEFGILLESLKRNEEAVEAHKKAIELDPSDSGSWEYLGDLHLRLKQYPDAEKALREAIRLNPRNGGALDTLRFLLQTLHRESEAEQILRSTVERDPQFAAAWASLGALLHHLGRHEEARQTCLRAVELDPNERSGWFYLAAASATLKHLEEAERAYRRAIELYPEDSVSWHNLGRLLNQSQRTAEAFAAYLKADALDKQYSTGERDSSFWPVLGRRNWAPADLPLLQDALSEYHSLFPENAAAAFLLAGVSARRGNWEDATKTLESVASSETNAPDVWAFQPWVEAGRVAEAVALLERTGANERWRPLYEALRAVQHGSRAYLNRVAPEVRHAALEIINQVAPKLEDGLPPVRSRA